MMQRFNKLIDVLSDFLASRKGLIPLIGIGLVLVNMALQFIPGMREFAQLDLFLHVGVVVAILGIMVAWAL